MRLAQNRALYKMFLWCAFYLGLPGINEVLLVSIFRFSGWTSCIPLVYAAKVYGLWTLSFRSKLYLQYVHEPSSWQFRNWHRLLSWLHSLSPFLPVRFRYFIIIRKNSLFFLLSPFSMLLMVYFQYPFAKNSREKLEERTPDAIVALQAQDTIAWSEKLAWSPLRPEHFVRRVFKSVLYTRYFTAACHEFIYDCVYNM